MMAGRLDRRITIQRPPDPEVPDSYGQPSKEPTNVALGIWAQKVPLRGAERIAASQQLKATVDTIFRIRFRSDVTPRMAVVEADGRVYDIQAVLELGRREGLELNTQARAE